MADTSYPGAGWMARWRMATAVRSMLASNRFDNIQPVDGEVVGVTPTRGVMICDPAVAAATWSIGPATAGALQDTPSAIGVTPDGLFMISLRRGGGSGSEGCGGGTFPGWYNAGSPPCFANRQTVFEKHPIAADGQVAQDPTVGNSWDELLTGAWKTTIVCNDAGTLAAAIQPSATSKFLLIDLVTGALLGSVDTSITNNTTPGEPVFIGQHVYWPDVGSGNIFDFDCSTPASPTETIFAQPTLTSVQALRADGVILYACGTAGFASHTVEPLAEVDTVTGIGNWQSMAYDETADVICAFRKFDASNIAYVTIDVAGTALTLNTQADNIAATVGAVMDGSGCIAHEGVAICYSEKRALSGANTLDAHQFGILDPAAVFLEQTLNFTHTGGVGNIGPVASPKFNALGMRSVFTFNFGSDARVLVPDFTDVEIPLPKCVSPLPVDLGGTGIDGDSYLKGDLLTASGPGVLVRLPVGSDAQVLTAVGGLPAWVATAIARNSAKLTRSVAGLVTSDDFDRADGNPGAPWTEHQPGWVIASNRLINAAAAFERATNTDVSRGPMMVQAVLRTSSTAVTPRLTARYDYNGGSDNGYEAVLVTSGTTKIQLFKRVTGVATLVAETNVSLATNTDYVAQLYVADGVQQLHVNGVTVSGTDTDHDAQNARSAGLNHFNGATGTYDDFLVCKGRDVVVSGLAPGFKAKILNASEAVVATATEVAGTATIDASRFGGASEAVPLAGWPALIVTDGNDVEFTRYDATGVYPGGIYTVTISEVVAVVTVTSGITLDNAHRTVLCDASSSGELTVTLPPAVGNNGRTYNIHNIGSSGTVIIEGDGSDEINGALTLVLASQYDAPEIVSDNAAWRIQ